MCVCLFLRFVPFYVSGQRLSGSCTEDEMAAHLVAWGLVAV